MSERLNILYEKKPCYDIVFSSSYDELLSELNVLGISERKICVITDSTVAGLYSEDIMNLLKGNCKNTVLFTFPAGEENKTLLTVKDIYELLIKEKFDRKDLLIALGGGVVGDITGFAAATYLRGIDFIQIPTTLIAQSDSSIGGKTGVDFDGYKNMVGAFYMPKLVYMNVSALKTLDDRQFFSGFAEVMKHGLIKDMAYFQWLDDNSSKINALDNQRSCKIKKLIVEKDPTEKGDRALLNFGHTIGHAIEKYKNFSFTHGECVALGVIAAAFISWKHEWLSMEEYYEIRDMFVPFNLPISIQDINPDEILELTKSDKKTEGDCIKFILLKKVGKAVIDRTVTDDDIIKALAEIQYMEDCE